MYGEGGLESGDQATLEDAIGNNMLMSVRSLSGGFSEEYDRVSLSYAESYSIVNFLIEQYGQEKMTRLLMELSAGVTGDAALQTIYGFDVDGLEDAWRESIGADPRLQTANPTPVPTPTIVPTYAPVTGLQVAATPMPMPTVPATGNPTPVTSTQEPTTSSGTNWLESLLIGVVCCGLAAFALAGLAIMIFRRRRRRNL